MTKTIILFFAVFFISCKSEVPTKSHIEAEQKTTTTVKQITSAINIDGRASEAVWTHLSWHPINQVWLGETPTPDDFQGRYKLGWNSNYLYVLAEIKDDTLVDTHLDGLDRYWDDDCLEIFVDENASKGDHQYNHNAFAYHISLEGIVTDIGLDSLPQYYKHAQSKRITNGHTSTWEVAIRIYPDSYKDGVESAPVRLTKDKKMGFAIAYCDNDHSEERENFIGSIAVEGTDKNRGWIDAGIFEEVILTD